MLTGRTRSLCTGYLSNISEYIYIQVMLYIILIMLHVIFCIVCFSYFVSISSHVL